MASEKRSRATGNTISWYIYWWFSANARVFLFSNTINNRFQLKIAHQKTINLIKFWEQNQIFCFFA